MDWSEYLNTIDADRNLSIIRHNLVDLTGDLVAGILLGQILYWHLPSTGLKYGSKLKVKRENGYWLVKSRNSWWNECRISEKQYDRGISILKELGLVNIEYHRFNGFRMTHIQLIKEKLLQGVTPKLTDGEDRSSPKVKTEIPETVRPITETTTEITTKTTKNQATDKSVSSKKKEINDKIKIKIKSGKKLMSINSFIVFENTLLSENSISRKREYTIKERGLIKHFVTKQLRGDVKAIAEFLEYTISNWEIICRELDIKGKDAKYYHFLQAYYIRDAIFSMMHNKPKKKVVKKKRMTAEEFLAK